MSINYNSADTANTINRAIDNSMGLTTTDQGASSAGLIIKEDLQPVVQCTNGFDYAVNVKEISGVPPLSFHSMGQTLTWSLDGNTDSGNSVGDKTNQLFDKTTMSRIAAYVTVTGLWTTSDLSASIKIPVESNTTYTISIPAEFNRIFRLYSSDDIDVVPSIEGTQLTEIYRTENLSTYTFTTGENAKCIIFQGTNDYIGWFNGLMLNTGSTALPYEPYGYDVPIVVNNTDTYHCYITDVLRSSNGETPVYDTMNSDGRIIRRVDTDGTPLEEPTEETYTAPSVEVPWGNNTVDVDTTVTPSSMYIKYKDN